MADQATSELQSAPTQELPSIEARPTVTSVANPRRIRLTRLGSQAARAE